ncbi:YbfB/YjiJ family MFS transporter [Streptomyces sp. NPDC058960]|uniref:YbfB/YjiJ family MFS transporter n=1 Tax=Streptomyces sp. NPDC058960 TaxID=3346679 RepID=UPI00369FFF7A
MKGVVIAGFTSALAFVYVVGALLSGLRRSVPHLVGWGFGGIGAGIVFSGVLVLAVREVATWRTAWWIATVFTLLLTAVSWKLARRRPARRRPAPVHTVGSPHWRTPAHRSDRQRTGLRRAGHVVLRLLAQDIAGTTLDGRCPCSTR